MNSEFWSRLIEAIVAFFFCADMKGMMTVEMVFEYVMGFVVVLLFCVKRLVHMLRAIVKSFFIYFWVHSRVIHNDGPVEAQRSAMLSGNKNLQVSRHRGSSLVCMTLQMCYFERDVSSESEV